MFPLAEVRPPFSINIVRFLVVFTDDSDVI